MSMGVPLDQPLRFQPYFRPAVWGGQALARFLGKSLPTGIPCGESWEVSDHPLHTSVLATGSLHGMTLRQLMETYRSDLLGAVGEKHERFPWLIKLLDAHDWLSVQVHPDEHAVSKLLPGEGAKSEAWLVLDVDRESRIYAGLRPGIGSKEIRTALPEGRVADCLHSFTPKPGDFLYFQAGTVHAVGGGVLLAEIQQTSDATFRLYDWGRKDAEGRSRPLHVEEALACIDWQQGPLNPISTQLGGPAPEGQTALVRCPYFEIDHLCRVSEFALGGAGRLQALIVAQGQGRFDNGEFVMAGDAWVLPARMPKQTLHVEAPLSGLLCTLPAEPGRQ
jgi:mannose-6-phosphate isomerase